MKTVKNTDSLSFKFSSFDKLKIFLFAYGAAVNTVPAYSDIDLTKSNAVLTDLDKGKVIYSNRLNILVAGLQLNSSDFDSLAQTVGIGTPYSIQTKTASVKGIAEIDLTCNTHSVNGNFQLDITNQVVFGANCDQSLSYIAVDFEKSFMPVNAKKTHFTVENLNSGKSTFEMNYDNVSAVMLLNFDVASTLSVEKAVISQLTVTGSGGYSKSQTTQEVVAEQYSRYKEQPINFGGSCILHNEENLPALSISLNLINANMTNDKQFLFIIHYTE
jgi:hypothetical protein